jgi:hypothetical protein
MERHRQDRCLESESAAAFAGKIASTGLQRA